MGRFIPPEKPNPAARCASLSLWVFASDVRCWWCGCSVRTVSACSMRSLVDHGVPLFCCEGHRRLWCDLSNDERLERISVLRKELDGEVVSDV